MILSLSGGLDSSSLLFEYKDNIELAVSFRYGSNHNELELAAAAKVAKEAGVPHRIIDVREVFHGFNSALLSGKDAVPNADYDKESISKLVVPFRNGIFLSILAGIADSLGTDKIALANHAGDHSVYPDCTPEFSNSMADAIKFGTIHNIEFFCPYVNVGKKDIALRGIKHGLNPDWTYSCYKGEKVPCHQCPTCRERDDALAYAYHTLEDETC